MSSISLSAYNRSNFYWNNPEQIQETSGPVNDPAAVNAGSRYFADLENQLAAYQAGFKASLPSSDTRVNIQPWMSQKLSELKRNVEAIISKAPDGSEGLSAAAKRVGGFFYRLGAGLSDSKQKEVYFGTLYVQLDSVPEILQEVSRQRQQVEAATAQPERAPKRVASSATQAKNTASATQYPTSEQAARTLAQTILKEQYGLSTVDPDQVRVEFQNTSLGEKLEVGLFLLSGKGSIAHVADQAFGRYGSEAIQPMSLTEAVLKHFAQNKMSFTSKIQSVAQPALGSNYLRMYYVDKNGNTITLDPKKAAAAIQNDALETRYNQGIDHYWTTKRPLLIAGQSQRFAAAIARQKADRTLSEVGASFLSQQLNQPSIGNNAQPLSIKGYVSTDLLVFKVPGSQRVILYIAGDAQPIQEFQHEAQLQQWVMARLVLENQAVDSPRWREAQQIISTMGGFSSKNADGSAEYVDARRGLQGSQFGLLTHFSAEDRFAGLDEIAQNIGMKLGTPKDGLAQVQGVRPSFVQLVGGTLQDNSTKLREQITLGAFSSLEGTLPLATLLATRQKERQRLDGRQAIVSDSDVQRYRAGEGLRYLETLGFVLLAVAPEFALPLIIVADGAELGIAAYEFRHAHDQQERDEAMGRVKGEVVDLMLLGATEFGSRTFGALFRSGSAGGLKGALTEAAPNPAPLRLSQELSGLSQEGISLAGKTPEANGTYLIERKFYISVEGKAYQVLKDDAGWRVLNPDNAASRGIPVRLERNQWVSNYQQMGLRGGVNPNLSTDLSEFETLQQKSLQYQRKVAEHCASAFYDEFDPTLQRKLQELFKETLGQTPAAGYLTTEHRALIKQFSDEIIHIWIEQGRGLEAVRMLSHVTETLPVAQRALARLGNEFIHAAAALDESDFQRFLTQLLSADNEAERDAIYSEFLDRVDELRAQQMPLQNRANVPSIPVPSTDAPSLLGESVAVRAVETGGPSGRASAEQSRASVGRSSGSQSTPLARGSADSSARSPIGRFRGPSATVEDTRKPFLRKNAIRPRALDPQEANVIRHQKSIAARCAESFYPRLTPAAQQELEAVSARTLQQIPEDTQSLQVYLTEAYRSLIEEFSRELMQLLIDQRLGLEAVRMMAFVEETSEQARAAVQPLAEGAAALSGSDLQKLLTDLITADKPIAREALYYRFLRKIPLNVGMPLQNPAKRPSLAVSSTDAASGGILKRRRGPLQSAGTENVSRPTPAEQRAPRVRLSSNPAVAFLPAMEIPFRRLSKFEDYFWQCTGLDGLSAPMVERTKNLSANFMANMERLMAQGDYGAATTLVDQFIDRINPVLMREGLGPEIMYMAAHPGSDLIGAREALGNRLTRFRQVFQNPLTASKIAHTAQGFLKVMADNPSEQAMLYHEYEQYLEEIFNRSGGTL